MRTRAWCLLIAAILVLDVAGMVYGSDRLASYCVVASVIAPVFISIVVLAIRLGPQVLGR